jgi:hypothetical protein
MSDIESRQHADHVPTDPSDTDRRPSAVNGLQALARLLARQAARESVELAQAADDDSVARVAPNSELNR